MKLNRAGLAAAAFVTVGAGVLGGAAIAAASGDDGASANGGPGRYGFGSDHGRGQAPDGTGQAPDGTGQGGMGQDGMGQGAPHEHTEVTGDELGEVTDAVTAYDATITVDTVLADPDGSYDVLATQDGAPVMLEVSADLVTITARTGGPGGRGTGDGDRGPGAPSGEVPSGVPDPTAANT